MGLPVNEQETIVQYNRDGSTATIYTSDTTQMTRLDKIYSRHKEHRNGGEVVAVEYIVEKGFIAYRSKRAKSSLTAEQKAAIGEKLKAAREKAHKRRS